MRHCQSEQGIELTQCKLIKHFYTHLDTSNLRPERAKLTIRVQQTSNEFKSFHWNGTSVEIFLQLMENVFRIIANSEFANWLFFTPRIQHCWCSWNCVELNSGLQPDEPNTPQPTSWTPSVIWSALEKYTWKHEWWLKPSTPRFHFSLSFSSGHS